MARIQTCELPADALLGRYEREGAFTDCYCTDLAEGRRDAFAAWHVEARAANQILLCDFQGSTRSWLMSSAAPDGASTRVYFGSAVLPRVDRHSGELATSGVFRALLGFHKLYSLVLLKAAVARLRRAGFAA